MTAKIQYVSDEKGEPVSVIVPIEMWREIASEPATEPVARKPRIAGLHSGSVWVSEDFDSELPDEFWIGSL